MSIRPKTIPHAYKMRLKLWLGKPFGYFFVPESYVQVIYRDSRYYEVRGPGLVRVNSWNETLGPLVELATIVAEYVITGVLSRDKLPVTIKLNALIFYDPRDSSPSIARALTNLTPDQLKGIPPNYFHWALSRLANQFTAAELEQGGVQAEIEKALAERVNQEMGFLGLTTGKNLKILQVQVPKSLAARREQVAQRKENIIAQLEFEPEDVRRALVTEMVESMNVTGGAQTFLNFGEMLESFVDQNARLGRRVNVIDQDELKSKPLSSESVPPAEEPADDDYTGSRLSQV